MSSDTPKERRTIVTLRWAWFWTLLLMASLNLHSSSSRGDMGNVTIYPRECMQECCYQQNKKLTQSKWFSSSSGHLLESLFKNRLLGFSCRGFHSSDQGQAWEHAFLATSQAGHADSSGQGPLWEPLWKHRKNASYNGQSWSVFRLSSKKKHFCPE